MAQNDLRYARPGSVPQAGVEIDEGLRSYMLRVYNYMAGGLALSGLVAYTIFNLATTSDPTQAVARFGSKYLTQFGAALFGSPLMWVLILAPLAFVLILSFRVYKMSPAATQLAFWAFATVMGASLSTILLRYTGASIANVFAITAASFAALSLFGYTTKRDLSGWGSFLIMGVIGLILASLLNLFIFQSGALQFAVSALGVLIFAGLTAYDTQQIKDNYYAVANDGALATKTAVMGALNLYLDFINMFQSLLYLMGDRE